MLSIGLFTFLIAVPLFSYRITSNLFNNITIIILIYSIFLSYNSIYIDILGIGIYSGLFHVSTITVSIEIFIFFIGSFLIIIWAPINNITIYTIAVPKINEYFIIIIFTLIGSSILISSNDIISIYLSIELQSFAVYIIATIYRNSESSTAAGLKYFLLGGLSSAILLIGTSIIYSYTGITQFDSIFSFLSINSINNFNKIIIFGIILIIIGFIFKVGAAPFHNWSPDVYDGTPTIITSWLSTMPKISIFVFIIEIQFAIFNNNIFYITENYFIWKNILLIVSLLSFIIGTVQGLSQYRIKRLLTYSTISHIGFIFLSLSINTQESIESFIFYIIQYTITNINIFIVLLAFGYFINFNNKTDIIFINDLKGQFKKNTILSISFTICIFSLAGIPPIIGFFAKQIVLYSSIYNGYYFISFIAIVISVISAFYYLKIIKVIFFENDNIIIEKNSFFMFFKTVKNKNNNNNQNEDIISNKHSFIISILSIIIIFFMVQPNILLNSCQLLSLTIFYN